MILSFQKGPRRRPAVLGLRRDRGRRPGRGCPIMIIMIVLFMIIMINNKYDYYYYYYYYY